MKIKPTLLSGLLLSLGCILATAATAEDNTPPIPEPQVSVTQHQGTFNGEKIKFCYLKLPNPIHENVFSFIQEFPSEVGINKYIDHDLQFEKGFLDPLKAILDAIGWSVEKTVNLELFFS